MTLTVSETTSAADAQELDEQAAVAAADARPAVEESPAAGSSPDAEAGDGLRPR